MELVNPVASVALIEIFLNVGKTTLESLTEEVKQRRGNPGYKLLKGGEMGSLIKIKFFVYIIPEFNKFYKIKMFGWYIPSVKLKQDFDV